MQSFSVVKVIIQQRIASNLPEIPLSSSSMENQASEMPQNRLFHKGQGDLDG